MIEQDKFIEDMNSMYCSMSICSKVHDHFEENDILTEGSI